jgi:hypothetical protein
MSNKDKTCLNEKNISMKPFKTKVAKTLEFKI